MFENRQIALIEGKCRRFRNCSEFLKAHCAVPRKIYLFGCKRCQKKRNDVDYKLLEKVFSKIFFRTRTAGCQKFVQYNRMLYPGRFILI